MNGPDSRDEVRARRSARRAELAPARRRTDRIIGDSPAIQRVLEMIAVAARTDIGVVIQGESGTGKELVARAIHDGGRRAGRPFLTLNCGAIPENLIEGELFGHARGAFTGAHIDKKGVFEEADGGSLFLDEIAEMSPRRPGQPAAGAAGGRGAPRRGDAHPAGRRAGDRGDQPRSQD